MSLTQDGPYEPRPGETRAEYERRLKDLNARKNSYAPGGYMSTRNADGSSRGGAAEMFERYGFF